MYTIYFHNFGYGPEQSFDSFNGALLYAKACCFEATILHNSKIEGYWSPIGGYHVAFTI